MDLLQALFIAMPFVVAAGLAMLLCLFLATAFRSPTAGLWAVGFLCLWDTLLPNSPPLQLGLLVYMADLVSMMVGLVTLLRVLFSRTRPPIPRAWYLFVAVVAVSFVFGVAAFGTAAGGSLRPYFYAIVFASYFMTFSMDEVLVRRAITGFTWIALGILLVVFARWVIVAVPIGALLPPGGTFDPTRSSILRVIGADSAAVIGQVFLVGLFYAHTSSLLRYFRPLVALFALAVIGLQHRSVWAAALAAVGARFALPAAGRRGSTQLLVLGVVLTVLTAPVLLSGRLGNIAQDITQSASRAVAMTDTAQVRFESWKFAIGKWEDGGPRAWIIGLPIGTSMDRYSITSTNEVQRISFQAHNYYVQTLFNFGVLGLGANLFIYFWVMRQLYRLASRPVEGAFASALLLLLTLQLGFYVTYGVSYMQGMVLGVAVAYAVATRARLVPEATKSRATEPPRTALARPLGRGMQ